MVTCTGHIGIHEWADGRTDVRTYVVRTYGRWWRHGYKTKFPHIDGLPYFLNYGAPRARAFGARGAPLQFFMQQYISKSTKRPAERPGRTPIKV